MIYCNPSKRSFSDPCPPLGWPWCSLWGFNGAIWYTNPAEKCLIPIKIGLLMFLTLCKDSSRQGKAGPCLVVLGQFLAPVSGRAVSKSTVLYINQPTRTLVQASVRKACRSCLLSLSSPYGRINVALHVVFHMKSDPLMITEAQELFFSIQFDGS